MKTLLLCICVLVCNHELRAQTQIDLRTQGKHVDFGNAISTRPAKTGSILPATCSSGDMFFLSTAAAGKNLYGCTSTNIWSVQSAGSGLPETLNNSGKILTTNGTDSSWSGAAGDIAGPVDSLTVTRIRGRSISTAAPANGESLIWNSTADAWQPALVSGGGGGGAVSSVAGKVGAVTLELANLIDCGVVRTNAAILTIGSCKFSFPNRNKVSLANVTITATAGVGSAYIYLSNDGVLRVGRNGSLTIACSGCNDAGLMNEFPDDVARVAAWPATAAAAEWDAIGQTDERTLVRGPMQITPGAEVSISTGALGETQISMNTAVVQTKSAAQAGQETLCEGLGSAGVQTCTLIPMLTAYTPGMRIRFRPAEDNPGAQTLNIDTRGAIPIKLANGLSDPAASELSAGNYYDLTYDGAAFRLPARVSAGAGIVATPATSGAQVSIDLEVVQTKAAAQAGQEILCVGTGSAAAQTCTMSPALAAYTLGMRIRFQPGTANTGTQTIAADGLAATVIKKADGLTDPEDGELAADSYYDLTYDGTVFRMAPGTSGGSGSSPKTIEYVAAKCQNGFAASGFSYTTTGFPNAACVTGANATGGVLQFTDASTQSVQDHFVLPSSVSSTSLDIWWRANAIAGSSVWQVQTGCVTIGEDGDIAWNAPQILASGAQASANRWQKASLASVTLTGCAVNEVFRFKLFRDPAHASDTIAATVDLISVVFTVQP